MLIDNPPALEGQTSSEITGDHLNVMHAAQAAFTESEPSEKRRRATTVKTRTQTSLIYESGDIVYFKPENNNLCKGPGTVIRRENMQILVKYGGTYLGVHAYQLQHV